jgi:PAS domain S-box-containing protein
MNSSNHRFKAIFQHSHVGILIINGEGNIEDINPFCATIFGYAQSELINQQVEFLIPEYVRKVHLNYRKAYLKNPVPRSMGFGRNLIGLKKDGTEFFVEISLCSYDFEEKINIVCFINDISERKKTENYLTEFNLMLEKKVKERTEELSQALVELNRTNVNLKMRESKVYEDLVAEKDLNEMKSRFVSMASHEFRTPLAGILSSITLIEKYQTSDLIYKQDKHIKTIKRSVKNLTEILNDFLSLDKLNQGIVGINPIQFNLPDLINCLIDDTKYSSQSIQKINYKHSGEEAILQQDGALLRNIIINLLSNAMKYSPDGKDILIESETHQNEFIVKIVDQGIGIPDNEQGFLFEKFFRGRNAINIEGTGLGLNIVKRYLSLMKGTISFISNENIGSTFSVIIPKEINNEKNTIN